LATISICTAESLDLENKFNDTEYNIQLKDMIVEINKLDDDVGLGRITQETANKTAASLIDDPRYNQVKLKKQIDERDHEILLRDKSRFNDTEYNIQLKDMIVEINKLNDDVELGRITQETANKTVASLIDDPRYNQVKLKKQIVEREHEILLRNERPPLPNCTASLTNSLLNPIGLSNTIYYYPYVGEMRVYSDGWGVGYAEAIKHEATTSDPDQYVRVAARVEGAGSYYADGYMFSYTSTQQPPSGNANVGVDFDWIGGCVFPDDCTIDFVLWELVEVGPLEYQWVKAGEDQDVVSLTGITSAIDDPSDASGSFSNYMDGNILLYCFALEVHTNASCIGSASSANFGFADITRTSRVKWNQGRIIY